MLKKFIAACLLAGLWCVPLTALGQDSFSLGMLDAEGLPVARKDFKAAGVPDTVSGIRLTAVQENGPAAKAGLKVDDVIVGANKAYLAKEKDAVYRLVELTETASSVEKAQLDVVVVRDGKQITLKAPLEFLGKHSQTCPLNCERCDKSVQKSIEYLLSLQQGNGPFYDRKHNNGYYEVMTSLCGLVLLASGSTMTEGPYATQIKSAVDYIVLISKNYDIPDYVKSGSRPCDSLHNWYLAFSLMFLCEVYNKTPTDEIRKKLEYLSDAIVENQEPSGGWGHGPGGTNSLGYRELEVVGNWCLAALGMAKQVGLAVPDSAIQKAVAYVGECGDGGAIGYSHRPGQKGAGEPGRTAGAIFAFAMAGQKSNKLYGRMVQYFDIAMKDLPRSHASPVLHFMHGGLACCQLEPKYWKKYAELLRPEMLAGRRSDGTYGARPADKNPGNAKAKDSELGRIWSTAAFALVLQLPKGNLPLICGGGRK
jgi:hypothetical protein